MPDDTIQYGKRVGDLQSGITVDRERNLHGTLFFVKDYKEFNPTDTAEQSGNYVAMRLPDGPEVEISSGGKSKSLPPEDRDLVWRVKDNSSTLTVKTPEREETYSASGLELQKDPAAVVANVATPISVAVAPVSTSEETTAKTVRKTSTKAKKTPTITAEEPE